MKKINIDFNYPDDSFYFSYREVIGHFTMLSNHFHNQYELYYLLSGERNYFIKDRIYHVKPGSLVLINQHDLHKTTDGNTLDHERILINFSKSYISFSPYLEKIINELFTKGKNVVSFLPVDQQYIEDLFHRMIGEIQNKALGCEVALQALFMELLVYTSRCVEENQYHNLENMSPMHEQILEIVQYINNNFTKQLSLPEVSKKFFISQYYLSRAFKHTTGFTFVEYVNSIRIREAQRLLREEKDKIIDIVEKVGFKNLSHFGRVFKEITGYSPLSYRKLNKIYTKNTTS